MTPSARMSSIDTASIILLLLGFLLGIVASIAGNLLTPSMTPLWAKFRSLQRSGYKARIREELKPLQVQLDQLNRFKESERDLYLYLFQWSLSIIAFVVAGVACAFVARSLEMSPASQELLLSASLALLLVAVISCLVTVWSSFDYTSTGMQKRIARLEANIAKLTAKLLLET